MSVILEKVERLTVTFLVDNCIEWMTQLPPGFTHELNQHLFEQEPPVDERTGGPIVDLEHFCCGAHGFSALIETQVAGGDKHKILFDTGPDSRSLLRNIEALQIRTQDVDCVVISHWHSDHTGGLLSFLNSRNCDVHPTCPVDVHPDRPIARGIAPRGKFIGQLPADPTLEQIRDAKGDPQQHSHGHSVANGAVWVSGEIPRVSDFETGMPGAVRYFENNGVGSWVTEEHIMDERYAVVDVAGKGLVIFSACSHAGIVNIVKDAVATFSRPIYMIIGGLHLAGPEFTPRIRPTVDFLSRQLRPSPAYILPMHCSGFQTKVALEHAFGEGCVPAGVGIKVHVVGDWEMDNRLMPPVY